MHSKKSLSQATVFNHEGFAVPPSCAFPMLQSEVDMEYLGLGASSGSPGELQMESAMQAKVNTNDKQKEASPEPDKRCPFQLVNPSFQS